MQACWITFTSFTFWVLWHLWKLISNHPSLAVSVINYVLLFVGRESIVVEIQVACVSQTNWKLKCVSNRTQKSISCLTCVVYQALCCDLKLINIYSNSMDNLIQESRLWVKTLRKSTSQKISMHVGNQPRPTYFGSVRSMTIF